MLYHCARSSSCGELLADRAHLGLDVAVQLDAPSSESTARARGAADEISASASDAAQSDPAAARDRSRAHRLHRATPQRPSANSGLL